MWVYVGCGGILSCSDWRKIFLLFPLHNVCNFETYAAHRTPHTTTLCCLLQEAAAAEDTSSAAVQCMSSLLTPCSHGKLNVKHHRTTPKPEIYITVEKAEAALARK